MSTSTVLAPAQKSQGAVALLPDQSGGTASHVFSHDLVTMSDPGGVQAEGVRALRTHVMAQHVDHGRRALAVCAPNRGVGCTFIAGNLAVALSQIGIKTVLVDADLHSPGIDKLVRPARMGGGLVECLSSPVSYFSECIDFEVSPHLSIIYAGAAVFNPRELLAGERFQMLMDFCLRDFDVTIVDTPPANTSSDARRISTVVGYSLIVAARDRSFVNDVKVLAAQLRADHAKVVGTVLNRA